MLSEEEVSETLNVIETMYVGTQLSLSSMQPRPPHLLPGQKVPMVSGVLRTTEVVFGGDYGDRDFYHDDSSGIFWNWHHSREEGSDLRPEQQKEVDEAHSVVENKVRSFVHARQTMKAKTLSRGFYPFQPHTKGKGKSRFKRFSLQEVLASRGFRRRVNPRLDGPRNSYNVRAGAPHSCSLSW